MCAQAAAKKNLNLKPECNSAYNGKKNPIKPKEQLIQAQQIQETDPWSYSPTGWQYRHMQTQEICFRASVNQVSSELNVKRAIVTKKEIKTF